MVSTCGSTNGPPSTHHTGSSFTASQTYSSFSACTAPQRLWYNGSSASSIDSKPSHPHERLPALKARRPQQAHASTSFGRTLVKGPPKDPRQMDNAPRKQQQAGEKLHGLPSTRACRDSRYTAFVAPGTRSTNRIHRRNLWGLLVLAGWGPLTVGLHALRAGPCS